MDILLIGADESTYVRPASIHGMLWLQTHFDNDHWEAIASNQVSIPKSDAHNLSQDAKKAGLILSTLPTLSIAGKF